MNWKIEQEISKRSDSQDHMIHPFRYAKCQIIKKIMKQLKIAIETMKFVNEWNPVSCTSPFHYHLSMLQINSRSE